MADFNFKKQFNHISSVVLGYTPKDEQLDALESYTSGRDTIFVAPTGFGKSFFYIIWPHSFMTMNDIII